MTSISERGINLCSFVGSLKWLLLCPIRLVVEFVDQITAAIVRPAAGTHFCEISLGELDAAPALAEPFMFLLLTNFGTQLYGNFTWDSFAQTCPHPSRNSRSA